MQVFLLLAEEASWEEGDAEEAAVASTQELHLEVNHPKKEVLSIQSALNPPPCMPR